MNATESAIKEYVRLEYLKGNELERILLDINEQWGRNYTLKALHGWKIKGEWDSEKLKKKEIARQEREVMSKLPTYEVIKQDALSQMIEARDNLRDIIREDKEIGKKPNLALYTAFCKFNVEIVNMSGRVVIGGDNSITNIILNFQKAEKEKEREIIDVDVE